VECAEALMRPFVAMHLDRDGDLVGRAVYAEFAVHLKLPIVRKMAA
jgi:hypothetical protein